MPSVHDCHLYGYEFDARNSTLVLRTCRPHDEPAEFTEVWFHEVWTHHLECILGHDILQGVDEAEVAGVMGEFGDLFARLECHGWPRRERADESLPEVVRRKGLRVWLLSSSYGVAGFVVAGRMVMREAGGRGRLAPEAPS